ncbi:MAG: hypothetical protein FWE91_04900 [Defluviitaleaceae bacterium]|nr:hypothetical protein [Defluviitaleaceae bacterium]MCL2836749.1 hypothetical protein [Defluviitaleaceae bacterium]
MAKKKIIILAAFLAVILTLAVVWAVFTDIIILRKTEYMAGTENAVSILFVGSSQVFVGNVPRQLRAIAMTRGVEINFKDISRHGNRGGTLGELREAAISEMRSGRFDYVVLQDQTRRSLNNVEGLLDEIRILCDTAREYGAVPVLYNSAWATVNGRPDEGRLNISTQVYKRAADENDAVLINAAGAWIYAYQTIPGISLYTRFDPRGPHASKAGGFLTACVFAAELFDLHITEVPRDGLYKRSDAVSLAQTAWEFVTDNE